MPQQARAVAIMPNDLDQPTAPVPKNVEITSVRIPLQTLLSQMRKARKHMTTEHTVVRSGKLKRKPFNSNVASHLLTIATFGFSYPRVSSDTPITPAVSLRFWISRDSANDLLTGALSGFEFIDFRRDIVVSNLFSRHQFLQKVAPKIRLRCRPLS
jgi:hypothetical protein